MLRKIRLLTTYHQLSALRVLFLCLVSSVLLILSFPNFNIWLLAWFGFVPLFFAIRNKSKGKAFLLFYFTGVIFWLGIIYWLIHVTVIGMVILILYLALYFGIFGLIISTIKHKQSSINLLFIPSLWVILEYLRSHLFTGFGWALLGYSQYLNLPVIQIADITGSYGVSFLVMTMNVAIWQVIQQVRSRTPEVKKILVTYLPFFLFFLCVLGYGYHNLFRAPTAEKAQRVRISIIQGNIAQSIKWDAQERSFILNKYLDLSKQAAKDRPDLVVWPESAYPDYLMAEEFSKDIKQQLFSLKIPLLIGVVIQEDERYYNSALLISKNCDIIQRYDKIHLVPFGEYIPLKKIFPFLNTVVPIGDFTTGEMYTVFTTPARFAVLICFEDIFPELSRKFVAQGANFLTNITNDAWFSKTSSPYQHLQASVFRAVENRTPLVRAANTGISCFINPQGKIISWVRDYKDQDIFVSGYKTEEFDLKITDSFYTRFGDIFVIGCLVGIIYGTIINLFFDKRLS